MRYSEMVAFEKTRRLASAPGRAPMGRRVWWLLAGLVVLGFVLAGCSRAEYRNTAVNMATVGQVDLTRYSGRWYEIARFPNRFEEGCFGVTADYSLNPDGSVKVVNTCRKGALSGPVEVAEGRATKARPEGDRLRVGFVEWLPFAVGDYWILALDEAYQVAVIGNPAGTTGWVLARTPAISTERLEAAYAVLRANGYDVSRITLTPQAVE